MDKIEELLTRGVANIIPNIEELKKVLDRGKKLNVYLGIDPTSTRIHLGHTVALRKMQAFAEIGHNVTFLIGDFTALIGDTSDKDKERPVLSSEEIRNNFATYKEQAQKILDFSKVKVRYNSEWLKNLDFTKILKLCQTFSLNDFVSRELIRKRLDETKKVGLHEMLYPAMQGYDSYFMDTDIQLGGTDQTFNMQAGRTLQKNWRNKESFIIATEFLMGTDGRKMSKSWGNAIWLDDNPQDMFAKVMAIQDRLIDQYFILGTNENLKKIKEMHSDKKPMDVKKELAKIIVTELHGVRDAKKAQENFEQTVQKGEKPSEIPTFKWVSSNASGPSISHILFDTGLVKTISEGKRVITQRGTAINDRIINDPNTPYIPKDGDILRVGKRKFVKIKTVG